MSFFGRLRGRERELDSWLCVGLDPMRERLPRGLPAGIAGLREFLTAIIEATNGLALAYKANLAYYLREGPEGLQLLVELAQVLAPGLPLVLDAKFGDVGHTAQVYAAFAFETLGFSAVTVCPYVGAEAVEPFLLHADRGVFVLGRTSNPRSGLFQDHAELWLRVLDEARGWNAKGNVGVVIGATHPQELARARERAPELPFLIPGVGAQGGELAAAAQYGPTADGTPPLVNVGRSILYASADAGFAAAAQQAAARYRDELRRARDASPRGNFL